MRVVRARVPRDGIADLVTDLDELGATPVVTPVESDRGADTVEDEAVVVEVTVPPEAVEDVFERLAAAGVDEETYATVTAVETARAPGLDALESEYVEGTAGQEGISPEEIRTKAREMHPNTTTYYAMTLLSAVVATAGLLIDSPAVVVGSMVIAPQVSSALLTSVGAVIDDRSLLSVGLRSLAAGLALAVVGAAAFGTFLQAAAFVPPVLDVETVEQVSKRVSPGVLSLAVAVCAGAAGAVAFATALPVSLVGVMVAAALIPAAAAVGIGLAWGLPSVAFGSLLLLVVNASAIALVGVVTLRAMDYYPSSGYLSSGTEAGADGESGSRGADGGRRFRVTGGRLAVGLLVVVFLLGLVPMAAQVQFERQANAAVQELLTDEYDDLELVGVTASRASLLPGEARDSVGLTVSRPTGESYPVLADRVDRRVVRATGRPVAVTIVFRDHQSNAGSREQSLAADG
jgi:uncharacterized hydrophobic protein (TIGR00271 family)